MEELLLKFTKLQWRGYLFIFVLILLSYTGIADKTAISLMTETQQSTAVYAILLKTLAGALTFIPDNDALAPFIDVFDRAGALLFIASITITLQKTTLILLQTPIFSFVMLIMLIAIILNQLSNVLDSSFTILVRKYLIVLLTVRFFLTASGMIVYGAVGTLLDSNDENNAKRAELLNVNVQKIIVSNDAREQQNAKLDKEIARLGKKITVNEQRMEAIGTKFFGDEDSKVIALRKENEAIQQQIDTLDDKKIGGFAITSKMKIAIANIQKLVKDASEGIFLTISVFLLKIVIFPFITYVMAYKFGRYVIGDDTLNLITNSFRRKNDERSKNGN